MNDLVSIIMPAYNCEAYIAASIRSVLAQTYTNWELLIVDDCSTDDTVSIVQSFHDNRIKLFFNERNSGAAVSRNRALREAWGRWVAFLDSDDLWHPEKLERQISFMEENSYAFSYTNYEEMTADGIPNGITVSGPKHISQRGMFRYCWPGCLTVMYDTSLIGLIQINDIRKNNDYALWLKVCTKAECRLLEETLAQYRRGRTGSVSTHGILTMIKWHYLLFRQEQRKGVLSALYCTARNLFFGAVKKVIYKRPITDAD